MAITTSPASSPLLKNTSNKTLPKIQKENHNYKGGKQRRHLVEQREAERSPWAHGGTAKCKDHTWGAAVPPLPHPEVPHKGTALHSCFSNASGTFHFSLSPAVVVWAQLTNPPGLMSWCILIPPPAQLQLRARARQQKVGEKLNKCLNITKQELRGVYSHLWCLPTPSSYSPFLHLAQSLLPATSKLCWWQRQGRAGQGCVPALSQSREQLLRAPAWEDLRSSF